jgi:hypothetical protein
MTTENGNKSVVMKNSVINEKQKDPFIDRDSNVEPPELDFIDKENKEIENDDDSFIKI